MRLSWWDPINTSEYEFDLSGGLLGAIQLRTPLCCGGINGEGILGAAEKAGESRYSQGQ